MHNPIVVMYAFVAGPNKQPLLGRSTILVHVLHKMERRLWPIMRPVRVAVFLAFAGGIAP